MKNSKRKEVGENKVVKGEEEKEKKSPWKP
jgi:hypothetical protein